MTPAKSSLLKRIRSSSVWRWFTPGIGVKRWLATGLVFGFAAVVFMHATELTKPLTGSFLPAKIDPLHQVRSWDEIARMLEEERQKIITRWNGYLDILSKKGWGGIGCDANGG